MLQDLDPIGCLRWGSALGASCVRGIGATESVFRRDEAEKFLAQQELRIREMEHQRKMKELEVELEKAKAQQASGRTI